VEEMVFFEFEKHSKLFYLLHFEAFRVICFAFFEQTITLGIFNLSLQIEGDDESSLVHHGYGKISNPINDIPLCKPHCNILKNI